MDAFVVRKRKLTDEHNSELDTDEKLALLGSLFPKLETSLLLEILLAADGSLEEAKILLNSSNVSGKRLKSSAIGQQASLTSFSVTSTASPNPRRPLTRKGKTLHLYDPKDIETNTPCSIILNFLPPKQADALLRELLTESPTYPRQEFKLFDRVVTSPHTAAFYVHSSSEVAKQKEEFYYNGRKFDDVRMATPQLMIVSQSVKEAVNHEVKRRITERHDGKKLKYQAPGDWEPNCAFVNCYDGAKESVGYHSDQLTYLGPRAIIGSISLGVAREFRVRRIVARDNDKSTNDDRADAEGQISIHLPHNSLLVMHAEMQEEFKHSIAPALAIDPHPIAGNKRINITYRCYRDYLHPKLTPKCKCGIPCVLRCVQKKAENRGRYLWQCHSHYSPGESGCTFFKWAEFDDDGIPIWSNEKLI